MSSASHENPGYREWSGEWVSLLDETTGAPPILYTGDMMTIVSEVNEGRRYVQVLRAGDSEDGMATEPEDWPLFGILVMTIIMLGAVILALILDGRLFAAGALVFLESLGGLVIAIRHGMS